MVRISPFAFAVAVAAWPVLENRKFFLLGINNQQP